VPQNNAGAPASANNFSIHSQNSTAENEDMIVGALRESPYQCLLLRAVEERFFSHLVWDYIYQDVNQRLFGAIYKIRIYIEGVDGERGVK
jgi:hypothetical protein